MTDQPPFDSEDTGAAESTYVDSSGAPAEETSTSQLQGQHVVDLGTGQLSVNHVGDQAVDVHYDGRGAFRLAGDELRKVADYLTRAAGG